MVRSIRSIATSIEWAIALVYWWESNPNKQRETISRVSAIISGASSILDLPRQLFVCSSIKLYIISTYVSKLPW